MNLQQRNDTISHRCCAPISEPNNTLQLSAYSGRVTDVQSSAEQTSLAQHQLPGTVAAAFAVEHQPASHQV
jgi:hypothetical protein